MAILTPLIEYNRSRSVNIITGGVLPAVDALMMKESPRTTPTSEVVSRGIGIARPLSPQPATVEEEIGSADANATTKPADNRSGRSAAAAAAEPLPLALSRSSFQVDAAGSQGLFFFNQVLDGAMLELGKTGPSRRVVQCQIFFVFFMGPARASGAGCEG